MIKWFHVGIPWHVDWWSVTDWKFWILFAPQYHATMLIIALAIFAGEVILIHQGRRSEALLQQLIKQQQKRVPRLAVSFIPIRYTPRKPFTRD